MQVGICGLLFVLFVGLKLAEIITWSWLWVTAPLWLPLALAMVTAIVIVAVQTYVQSENKRGKL